MIPSDPTSLLTLDLVFVSMSKQSNTLSEASEVMRGHNRVDKGHKQHFWWKGHKWHRFSQNWHRLTQYPRWPRKTPCRPSASTLNHIYKLNRWYSDIGCKTIFINNLYTGNHNDEHWCLHGHCKCLNLSSESPVTWDKKSLLSYLMSTISFNPLIHISISVLNYNLSV